VRVGGGGVPQTSLSLLIPIALFNDPDLSSLLLSSLELSDAKVYEP
jgi:hypothetical protein